MIMESRTSQSIKNSVVALAMYFVNLVLQFYSRKIFLDYLGTEILGLNTTVSNILQFLNLAELGISSAVGFTLFKPLADKDHRTINEIVKLQGIVYKRIAVFILACSLCLMPFFPLIFTKMELSLWYAYATFGIMLVSSLLGYFVNYRQVVLTSNQEDYKFQLSFKLTQLIKVGVQMAVVIYMENPYVWWLVAELVFAFVSSYILHKVTMLSAPYLRKKTDKGYRYLREKYADILVKIKQLFFHKISGFVANQMAPLIIYMYMSLTEVALYGNYMLIYLGVISLVNAIFNGMDAGVGNLVVTTNRERAYTFFSELFSIRFWMASVICLTIYVFTPGFICLWIGKEYLLSQNTLLILVITLFLNIIKTSAGTFLYAYQLVYDIWAPITEAILSLGLSVLLGYWWGLNGILLGNLIAVIFISFAWKAYFVFKKGFCKSFGYYLMILFKHVLICGMPMIGLYLLFRHHISDNPISWCGFIERAGFFSLCLGITLWGFMYMTKLGMYAFSKRILNKLR